MTCINSCKIGENPVPHLKLSSTLLTALNSSLKNWKVGPPSVWQGFIWVQSRGPYFALLTCLVQQLSIEEGGWRCHLCFGGHWHQLNSGVSCKGGQERTSRSPWHLFDRCPLRLGHQLATSTLALYSKEPLPILACRTYFVKNEIVHWLIFTQNKSGVRHQIHTLGVQ